MNTQQKQWLTPEEYLEIDEASELRHEYYQGEIFVMANPTEPHAVICGNIVAELRNALKGRACRVYGDRMRIAIEATGLYTYPDVVVACGKARFMQTKSATLLTPVLIVEVLSPSTMHYDRGAKFEHYARVPSLREYLLVAQDSMHVEHRIRQPDGRWTTVEVSGPAAMLELRSIDCRLPMAEIYDKVDFFGEGAFAGGLSDVVEAAEAEDEVFARFLGDDEAPSFPFPPRIREDLDESYVARRPGPPPPLTTPAEATP